MPMPTSPVTPSPYPRKAARIAALYLVFASLWIFASDRLLTLALNDPDLLIWIGTAKGFVFVGVTTLLLFLLLRICDDRKVETDATPSFSPQIRQLVGVFLGLMLIVPLVGFGIVRLHGPQIREAAFADLHAIADLKAGQIESWLGDRRGDAEELAGSAGLAIHAERLVMNGNADSRSYIADRLKIITKAWDFDSTALLNASGQVVVSSTDRGDASTLIKRQLLPAALNSRQIQRSDLYRDASGHIHLDFVVPLPRNGGNRRPVAAVLLQAPVERFLFPLIQTWPTPSPSAESFLVRRDGDHVLFLNKLRHRHDAALTLLLPLDNSNIPAVAAASSGKPQDLESVDYRGVAVFSVTRPVADTPWHLVAKIDREEVMAPLKLLVFWVSLVAFVAVGAIAAAALLLWRQMLRTHQLELIAQASEKDKLLKLFYDMPFIGMSITSPTSKRFLHVNDRLCEMMGYAREELLDLTWAQLTHPDDLASNMAQLERLLAGEIDDYHLDKRFIRKDGGIVDANLRVGCVRRNDGKVELIVATAQDITENKRTEITLRESKERYRHLFDNMLEGFAYCRMIFEHGSPQDFVYIEVNNAFEKLTGLKDVAGKKVSEVIPGIREADPQLFDIYGRVALTGNPEKFEMYVSALGIWFSLSVFCPEKEYFVAVFDNITERRRAEKKLRQASMVFESTRDGVVVTDLDERILAVNRAFTEITGYTEKEALGETSRFLKSGRQERDFYQSMWAMLLKTGSWQGEVWNRRKNGEIYPEWLTISTVRDEREVATNYVAVFTDLSRIKHGEEELERLAHYDSLTDLPNRLLALAHLERALEHAQRHGLQVGVLYLDLDRFKAINDSLGHPTGDELILAVSQRLQGRLNEEDTLGRLGGDEFLIVLEPLDGPQEAAEVARDLLGVLAKPFELSNGQEVYIGASIGISVFPEDGATSTELLRDADTALYQAKDNGRNQYCFCTGRMNVEARTKLELEAALRRGLERDELLLHYQPKVDLATGRMTGAEALIRWQREGVGMVQPGQFIPLAEKTDLIVAIGNWVIDTACRQVRAWIDGGLRDVRVAVNVSARQFQSGGLDTIVAAALKKHDLSPDHLELEVTESMLMERPDEAVAMLGKLKSIGVKLSLDDFGTGYSSLAYLMRFPIDTLKIDQSFVRDIVFDPGAAMIAISIIALAHRMRLHVIAEGVETEEQLGFLRTQGCDSMQGYYFSRPVPAEAFADLMKEGKSLPVSAAETQELRTLLIVDDEPGILSALSRLLRHEGYRILVANGAREGMDILARESVQVILSDQRMPEMSGTEFLRRVKELHPNTVRIVLSGYTDLESIIQAVNEGALYKFLVKPWDDDLLREHLRDAFLYYEAIVRPRAVG